MLSSKTSRLLTGIPILAVFQNLRWNSNKTSLFKAQAQLFYGTLELYVLSKLLLHVISLNTFFLYNYLVALKDILYELLQIQRILKIAIKPTVVIKIFKMLWYKKIYKCAGPWWINHFFGKFMTVTDDGFKQKYFELHWYGLITALSEFPSFMNLTFLLNFLSKSATNWMVWKFIFKFIIYH